MDFTGVMVLDRYSARLCDPSVIWCSNYYTAYSLALYRSILSALEPLLKWTRRLSLAQIDSPIDSQFTGASEIDCFNQAKSASVIVYTKYRRDDRLVHGLYRA